MPLEPDVERAAHASGLPRGARILIAVLAIVVGIPLVLFAWIGGVVVLSAGGIPISPAQVLAWLLAVIVAVVIWPLALRRMRRDLWRRQSLRPPPAPTRGDAAARAVVIVVGALAIIALSGPRDLIAALADAGAVVSIGPRENGLLVQLVATIVILILAAPVFVVTQRRLRRMPADDPRRPRLEERQTWYFAAAIAWVVSLGVGLLVSLAAFITM